MKRKEVKDLHNQTRGELIKLLEELEKEVKNMKLDIAMHKSAQTGQVKEKGRDIARVRTVLSVKGEVEKS